MPHRSQQATDWRPLAAALRDQIASIRNPSGSTPAAAARALRTLDDLEAAFQQRLDAELDARRRRVVGPRPPERPTIYLIEPSPRGDALTERREGVARPMKVPAPVYRTVAAVVAALDAPTRFEPILAAVERAVGERVAPYCVRVPLRFWAAAGLISHGQARFAPNLAPSRFETETRRAWRRVASEPYLGDGKFL
jgi:hypothetical protein